ncbi:MAG: NAD(P)-binding domain-containing protein [Acidimicrobiales bacterium]|nr:NAD(P)-binding domain-containing protein [Acidimicrobiales bacterium]
MKIAVVGVGATGARAARQLAATDAVETVLAHDTDPDRTRLLHEAMPDRVQIVSEDALLGADVDAVLLATPSGAHLPTARALVGRGVGVVSTSDAIDDVRDLLALDPWCRDQGVTVVAGAAFSPGFSCLLARHAAAGFDHVDEVHVAKVGTGGPACARQHHRALGGIAVDWRDDEWVERPGGSGRELCWFPDPIGGADCYRAALPDAMLLQPAFPEVSRVTARLGATRRDRLTARLPMLRPPHPEGGPGALRVEVRGRQGQRRETKVLGAMDRPGVAAGAVAAVAALWVAERRLPVGSAGLAAGDDVLGLLADLARRGVRAAVFEGAGA